MTKTVLDLCFGKLGSFYGFCVSKTHPLTEKLPANSLFPMKKSSMSTWHTILPTNHINFAAAESTYSLEVFTNAAMMSRLAYEDNPIETFEKQRVRCATSLVVVKVIEPQPVHDGKTSEVRQRMLMGIARRVGAEEPTIYFAFRGTDNCLANCSIIETFAGNLGAHVHKGFYDQAKTVPVDIIYLCLEKYPCVITGHSLGGAISTLIGLDTQLTLSAFRFINAWESCETRAPQTGDDQTADQAAEQKTCRLSAHSQSPSINFINNMYRNKNPLVVITFGAPLVACHQLAMKASKEVFHNVLISGDPVMVLLNILPELLQKLNNEYRSKVIDLLQEFLKAAAIIHAPLAVVLKTAIDAFRELIKRAKMVSGVDRILEPFGIYYLYYQTDGVLSIPQSQTPFLSFFSHHLEDPATFLERLNSELLEHHSIQNYVDIFTKSNKLPQQFDQRTFAPDSNNIQHIRQLLDRLIYPSSIDIIANASLIEANETDRRSYLQVDVKFPSIMPERLFAVVYAQPKGDSKKSDYAVKVEYRRRINIDDLIVQTSVIVLIPVNNLSLIQRCDQLVLVTLFGDIVKVDMVMHYAGFIGTLKETTSQLLMKTLLRVILVNQGDISMAYTNAIQTAGDDNPIQALVTEPNNGNIRKIQDLFDELLAVTRFDLLQHVLGDVVEHVRSEMGFSSSSVSDDAIRDMPQTFATTPSSFQASPSRIFESVENEPGASIFDIIRRSDHRCNSTQPRHSGMELAAADAPFPLSGASVLHKQGRCHCELDIAVDCGPRAHPKNFE
ncbi:hypothetical protein BC936DRAFT_149240 [Jimgerdemannia flammicorona]|uniref:Fungal lipase-type domain-containing protein n=1 Tax=Jimgerdemannia flammicorona TaxID=994334 RepID=A0A433D181_9FUNG|nr:hypothetical protein BC936DRAFT_149240 [Jimgerdemannia flammicorona]